MVAVIVIIVVATVIYSVMKLGGADWLANFIPTLGSNYSEKINTPGDISNQPVGLKGDNPCIDADFFWSDSSGNVLNGKTIKPGVVYIAVHFKDSMGNLDDDKNPNILCGGYSVNVAGEYDNKPISTIIPESFFEIQQSESSKKINDKDYYMIPVDVKDPGWRITWFKKATYSFSIENGAPVRAGFQLFVND